MGVLDFYDLAKELLLYFVGKFTLRKDISHMLWIQLIYPFLQLIYFVLHLKIVLEEFRLTIRLSRFIFVLFIMTRAFTMAEVMSTARLVRLWTFTFSNRLGPIDLNSNL